MARLITRDGCGRPMRPTEREALWVRTEWRTPEGIERGELDLHGFGCLRTWAVDRENALAQQRALAASG